MHFKIFAMNWIGCFINRESSADRKIATKLGTAFNWKTMQICRKKLEMNACCKFTCDTVIGDYCNYNASKYLDKK